MENQTRSRYDTNAVWIKEPWKPINGAPSQTRWVFDRYVSMEEYDATKKTEQPGVLPPTEGFSGSSTSDKIAAGVLFAALFFGIVTYVHARK
jgi:hypothetical protein